MACDHCGVCDSDPTNDCVQDCAGMWGGTATVDPCGICSADPMHAACTELALEAVADTYAEQAAPDANHGSDPTLEVLPSDQGSPTTMFFKFDLSSLPAGVSVRATKLQATASSGFAYGGDGNVYATLVSDDTWSEGTLTWNLQPAVTGSPVGYWWLWYNGPPSDQTGTISTPELTSAVVSKLSGDKLASFALSSSGYKTDYYSRETADPTKRPQLKIEYLSSLTVVLEPAADAYVDGNASSSNFGTVDSLQIDPTASQSFYLRFDLSTIPAGARVLSAKLDATAYTGYAYGQDGNVYPMFVADDTWSETGITAANAPAPSGASLGYWWIWDDGSPIQITGTDSDPTLAQTVQGEVNGDRLLSLQLSSPGYKTYYYSREHADPTLRPHLSVTYQP